MLNKNEISKFIKIYEKHFSVKLDETEAVIIAENFLRIIKLVKV